ncbi:hypothetical protein QAD02_014643 [Eretmocerus hayati]|uniref:Uncharacterized protein n=1 Tax=Eretmocerus hayati TaxID=131215 RepID=A0ACC2P746_9HYME|nr:hypothetical protein QAD02_014643 [Eretmocerus hayati]
MDELLCHDCGSILRGIQNFNEHYKVVHDLSSQRQTRPGGFTCGYGNCRVNMVLFSSLTRHIRNNHLLANQENNAHENEVVRDHEMLVHDAPLVEVGVGRDQIHHDQIHVNNEQIHHDQGHVNNGRDRLVINGNEHVANRVNEPMNPTCAASRMIAKLRLNTTFTGANLIRVSEAGVDLEDIGFNQFFQSLGLREPFLDLNSIEKQEKNLQKHCIYNPSDECLLGTRHEQRLNRKTKEYELTEVPETFQFASVIKSLTLLLSHKEVRDHIKSEKCSPNGMLKNTRDGNNFHSNAFFLTYPTAIRLVIYNDDLIVNNVAGTKTHSHKLGTFYYKVDNLPDHLNEFLAGIQAFLLYYAADKDKYGMERILEPFLNELEQLESDEGVLIQIDGEDFILRASIINVSADTLAAHELLGFLAPAARHFCRECMISRDQLRSGLVERFQIRTKELHQRQLEQIRNDPAASTETGVNCDSPLHRSRYFHATNNHHFDIMHDDLQGMGQLILKLAILHFTTNREYNFSINLLNSRIDKFAYGSTEIKNKPSGTFKILALRNLSDHSVPQKAMQTWCLLRVLPFLVSDKVPEDDVHLQILLLLNRINEIIFSFKLPRSILVYLKTLIREFKGEFYSLYSNLVNPINKLHHFDHYDECIEKCGPLRPLCCLIFEMKHAPFKKYATICCNFKNIPKTLMKMNQINQSAIWGTNEPPREKVEGKAGDTVRVRATLGKDLLVSQLGYSESHAVRKCDNIRVYGIQYTLNLMVAIRGPSSDDDCPLFGKIKEIVVNEYDLVFLVCKNFKTVYLEESLNSYCVEEEELVTWESLLKMDDDKLRRMGIRFGPIEEIRALINRFTPQIHGVEYRDLIILPDVPMGLDTPSSSQSIATPQQFNHSLSNQNNGASGTQDGMVDDSEQQGSVIDERYIDVRKLIREHDKKVPPSKRLEGVLDNGIVERLQRSELVRITCKELVRINPDKLYPKRGWKELAAKSIVHSFPREAANNPIPWIPFFDPMRGEGLVTHRLRAMRKLVKKDDPSQGQRRVIPKEPQKKDCANGLSEGKQLLDVNTYNGKVSRLSMLPLKGNKSAIYKLMAETRPNRLDWIFSNGPDAPHYISDILKKFNKLKYYNGELISLDCKEKFPNFDDGKLFEVFPSFYAQRNIYYCWLKCRVFFDKTRDIPDANLRALILLAAVLPTSNYKKTNQVSTKTVNAAAQRKDNSDDDIREPQEKKTRVDFSTEKVPNENFIRFRDTNDELLKPPDKNEKGHIQPFMICATTGPERVGKFFIKADIDLISVSSCSLKAFDIFVKMHYVFDIHFAPDLELFYNFICAIVMKMENVEARPASTTFDTTLRSIQDSHLQDKNFIQDTSSQNRVVLDTYDSDESAEESED